MSKFQEYLIRDIVDRFLDFRGRTPKKLGMDWGNGDIKALSANNVAMGAIDFSKECYLGSEELYSAWMTKGDCKKGDVIMTMEAPLGNIAQIPDDKKYILSQRTILFKTKPDIIDNDYFYYVLMSEAFQKELEANATGTTAKGIQQKKLAKINILLPQIPQQKVIAHRLKVVDVSISNSSSIIKKLKEVKVGTMQDLFSRGLDKNGKLRPSYEEAPHLYKNSDLGMIPTDWDCSELLDLTAKITDRDHTTPKYVSSGKVIMSPTNFNEFEELDFSDVKYIEEHAHLRNRKKTDLAPGDIVFSRIGAKLGKACMVKPDFFDFSILHSMCQIRVNDKMSNEYLLHYLRYEDLQRRMWLGVQSIGVPDLGLGEIGELLVAHPVCKKEQEKIGEILKDLNEHIMLESRLLKKLQSIKKGLMQDLLTGKVQVKA